MLKMPSIVRWFYRAAVAGGSAWSLTLAAPPPTVAPPGQGPTYCQDVLPIFMGKCSRCHHAGSLLLNWLDYKTAFAWRAAIKRRTWDSWRRRYYQEAMPVDNSPEAQTMTPEERATIRAWVKAGAPYGIPVSQASAGSRADQMARGRRLFTSICALCHQPNAQGLPGRFPPLAHSTYLNADRERAIRTVLHGRHGGITVNGEPFNSSMPSLPLTDEQVADVLTFVYHSFGNSGQDVTAAEVKAVRSRPPTRTASSAHRPAPPPPPENNPYE